MHLYSNLKSTLRNNLLNFGVRLSRTTDRNRLLELLAALRPVETEHALIRLGGEGDGGYLVPDDLEGIRACFSPGVSDVAAFEEAVAARQIPCFLADYSVSGPPVQNPLFDFEKKFVGIAETDQTMTIYDWVQRKMPTPGDLLLQMDIEGAEYAVIADMDASLLRRFRIVVLEMHHLDALYDRFGVDLIEFVFAKLLRDFCVVHIHPNNCARPIVYKGLEVPPIMEFTFLRKDRVKKLGVCDTFPNQLDRTNIPGRPDFALPRCWYGGDLTELHR